MRILAKETGTGISSIYHFFKDKDELLAELFAATNRELGKARAQLPDTSSAEDMMLQRIRFQFEHIESIIFVLKYYLHFRPMFLKLDSGYIPTKGYLHIHEVLERGVNNKEFAIKSAEINSEAKVIAHAINGFLLEYYPQPPEKSELDEVANSINRFLMRSLKNKEVTMM